MNSPISIEVSAADVETAIAKGVEELGVSRGEVMVEVLEEPGRRLLGLGTRQARVRLTVIRAPSTPPAVPREAPAEPISAAAPSPTAPAPPRREKPEKREKPARTQPAPAPAVTVPPDEDFEDEELPASAQVTVSEADLSEEARVGAQVLTRLLTHMGIQATVTSRPVQGTPDEPLHHLLEVQGQDLGALIGRRGETLVAIQYLTRLLTSREVGHRTHLVVDVEGYKARREAMLRRLATRMAEQAVQRGRTVSMEPMPPHERRIVHLTLRDHPDVTTESIGEGDRRKVTVVPKQPKP
jgi:spoIIIJ-associated protein